MPHHYWLSNQMQHQHAMPRNCTTCGMSSEPKISKKRNETREGKCANRRLILNTIITLALFRAPSSFLLLRTVRETVNLSGSCDLRATRPRPPTCPSNMPAERRAHEKVQRDVASASYLLCHFTTKYFFVFKFHILRERSRASEVGRDYECMNESQGREGGSVR